MLFGYLVFVTLILQLHIPVINRCRIDFPSPGAREERPWFGLVTCLPEKNNPERRVVCCPIFLAYYFCQIQIEAYSIRALRKATGMFLSCLQFAIFKSSYSNVNLKVIQVKCLEAIYIRRDVVAVLPTG